jgi:hypothetical protein
MDKVGRVFDPALADDTEKTFDVREEGPRTSRLAPPDLT